jgi:putative secretion ATPase (PEP-CTERM system associated)
MYEKFYGFKSKPFELVPNPQFFYLSKTHRKALSFLEYGLSSRAGFILLTGDIGAGKTTIIRCLLDRLESKTVPARIFNTKADAQQLLFMINEDFGLCAQPKDKMVMLSDLNDFLIQKFSNNEKPILIIDEAQNLTPDCLEEVRLLSNLESNDSKLLQIILVGQPELKTVIAQPGLQQLRQRISVDCHLGVLSTDETREYFFHRLECAGNVNAATFPDDCFVLIHKASGGIPRLINILGDYLLLAGFSEGTKTPDFEMVDEVINDLKNNIAFHDVNNNDIHDNDSTSGTQSSPFKTILVNNDWPEINESFSDNIVSRLQRHENILKKVVRKQIAQSLATRERLEEIGASLHYIEETLKHLSRSNFTAPHTKYFVSRISSQNLNRSYRKTDGD